jgi:aminopeptidase N
MPTGTTCGCTKASAPTCSRCTWSRCAARWSSRRAVRLPQALQNKAPIVSGKSQRIEDIYQDERGGPGLDIYVKGALILHTLRNLIGDDAFFTATRRMVYGTATPAPGNFQPRWSSTKEFIQFANEASGRDLQWFFDAYLYHAALPELVEERSADKLKLTLEAERRRHVPAASRSARQQPHRKTGDGRWPR